MTRRRGRREGEGWVGAPRVASPARTWEGGGQSSSRSERVALEETATGVSERVKYADGSKWLANTAYRYARSKRIRASLAKAITIAFDDAEARGGQWGGKERRFLFCEGCCVSRVLREGRARGENSSIAARIEFSMSKLSACRRMLVENPAEIRMSEGGGDSPVA